MKKLKLIHRTTLYAGGLSLLACLLVSMLAILAFEWQERTLLESALQAGIDEMYGHVKVGGWPDLNNSPRVVSALAPINNLQALPEALRALPAGQTEIETGDYAEFIVLMRQIEGYRYYYGVSIAHSERGEANIVWIAVFLVLSAVVISALMGWLFARQLVRPLSAVAQAISDIDQTTQSVPLAHQNQDEIDQIVVAINRYQARLDAAAARETAFLSDVAHALRTPAAVIQSGLELLDQENAARNVISVSPDGRDLSAVVPHLRDFSSVSPERRDSSSVSPERRDFSSVSPERRDVSSVSPERRDLAILERVRRNSQQLVLKLDALMLSARKQESDGLERIALAGEVEQAMRYLVARGTTSFAIEIAAEVHVNVRVAVLRWVISQCANSFSEHQIVEISWQADSLVFAGKDAVFDALVVPELIVVVCTRERWQLSFTPASIRIVLPSA